MHRCILHLHLRRIAGARHVTQTVVTRTGTSDLAQLTLPEGREVSVVGRGAHGHCPAAAAEQVAQPAGEHSRMVRRMIGGGGAAALLLQIGKVLSINKPAASSEATTL